MPIPNFDTLLASALQGDARALNDFFDFYAMGEITETQKSQTLEAIQNIVDEDPSKRSHSLTLAESHALVLRGRIYSLEGGPDSKKAVAIYEEAEKLSNPNAMTLLATLYRLGYLVGAKDYKKALLLYEKAIQLGSSDAMLHLSFMHDRGLEVPKDPEAAYRLLIQSANLGNTTALFALHLRHVATDRELATKFLDKGCALEDITSLMWRASMYIDKDAIVPDYPKAIELYTKALELGYNPAQSNLDEMRRIMTIALPPMDSEHIKNPVMKHRRKVFEDSMEQYIQHGARFYQASEANHKRWKKNQTLSNNQSVIVMDSDWGEATAAASQETGEIYTVLNMAHGMVPGGGVLDGMVAQEENMFRRAPGCYQDKNGIVTLPSGEERYTQEMSDTVNGKNGYVYLSKKPRLCIKGKELPGGKGEGYELLKDDQFFQFYELRSAGVDLRGQPKYSDANHRLIREKIASQLETAMLHKKRHLILSAFSCGAFLCPSDKVAQIYREEIEKRAEHFDDIRFAIYTSSGIGPKENLLHFEQAFKEPLYLGKKAASKKEPIKTEAPAKKRKIVVPPIQLKPSEDNAIEENKKKLQAALAPHKKELDTLLLDLKSVMDGLLDRKKDKNYLSIATDVHFLYSNLNTQIEDFFDNPSQTRLKTCVDICKPLINTTLKKSNKHRGWHDVSPILRAIVGVLAAISIFPALLVESYSKHGYIKTFFEKPNTTTYDNLMEIQSKFDAHFETITKQIHK